jgi:DNA-binding CsgD family transcriptional regulator
MKERLPAIELSPGLQITLQQKLNELKAIENEIPAVIIVHYVQDATVLHMSERGMRLLNTTENELKKLGKDYYLRFFNPEDARDYVPKIMGLLERNNNDEIISYFQQVRTSENENWTWYLSSTRIFFRDEAGNPILTITTAIPIDAKHHLSAKAERLLEENNFLRGNQHLFSSLTKRELEILKYMALGVSTTEIAEKLFISEATALTHRRNIKSKINAQSAYDITRFAQAFNLI